MNKSLNESKKYFTLDKMLLLIMALFFAISLVGIYLSGAILDNGQAEAISLMKKQVFWYIIGFTLIFILIKIGIDRLFTAVNILYWILIVFLIGLAVAQYIPIPFSWKVNGTWGWYNFPGIGSFQPSEFMKIVLVIKTANVIQTHNSEKTKKTFSSDFQLLFKMALYCLPPLFLIFRQPDTGVPIVILFSLATMFLISGVRREWFIIVSISAIGLLFGIVYMYYNHEALLNTLMGGGPNSYRLDRFYGWLDYEKYAMNQGYQLFQALISIGTAGLTGHPIGQLIAHYPEAQTDFIFAVLAQNFGFFGAAFVIILCFTFDIKLVYNIIRSDLDRERYMMMGVVGMLFFQHLENMGMILGLLPITGITLPFISYGGSSIASYMIPMAVAFYMYSETQNRHRH